MRLPYLILTSLTYFVITSRQTYALVDPVKETAMLSDLQENLYQENNVDIKLEEKKKEKKCIELENALNKARLEKELADIQADIARMMLERERRLIKWDIEKENNEKMHKDEIMALNQQKEKLEAEVSIAQYKLEQEEQQFRTVIAKLGYKIQLLQTEVDQAKVEKERYEADCQRADYINTPPIYLKDPLQGGKSLVVSDRRIELNGCITPWKANYITDRIQYYNNKDTSYPIFILIESSPGGSIQAGACILKAMENSKAPVYVVVKGYAASMAALITTLADKSYAYPNAVILHHQPWTFTIGNVRELKEEQELLQEWWHRLGGRVAKKMGVSLKKLETLLYEKSAKGNWSEFADRAQKLKWVDHTIDGIQESSIRELPTPNSYTWKKYFGDMSETVSTTENSTVYLPPLEAKDFYYLYNPNNLYQILPSSNK